MTTMMMMMILIGVAQFLNDSWAQCN